jgi:hypothetical protein
VLKSLQLNKHKKYTETNTNRKKSTEQNKKEGNKKEKVKKEKRREAQTFRKSREKISIPT